MKPSDIYTTDVTPWPAPPIQGRYLTEAGLRYMEDLADRRAEPEESVQIQHYGTEVTCKTCRQAFRTGVPQQTRRCPACRASAGHETKQRGSA